MLVALGSANCSQDLTSPATPPDTTRQRENLACVARAVFGDPAQSPYVLPYPVGAAYRVSATCCDPDDPGHYNELAYDFVMPIGADVTASRAGIVEAVVDHFSDNGSDNTQSNYIAIRHDDGTVAGYGHTQQGGSVVRAGDRVTQGQLITHAGSSGTAGFPHLHVGVFPTVVWRRTDDVAFNYRNAAGPVDARGALIKNQTYTALPYQ
jgi:murein DD-endopeptidase MepM/ murein hydrolase activator NlpD